MRPGRRGSNTYEPDAVDLLLLIAAVALVFVLWHPEVLRVVRQVISDHMPLE